MMPQGIDIDVCFFLVTSNGDNDILPELAAKLPIQEFEGFENVQSSSLMLLCEARQVASCCPQRHRIARSQTLKF